jgi:hypothetical protein
VLPPVIILLIFDGLLSLLNLLEQVLDLLQELEAFLWLRLLPGHDVVGLVVHLLEIGLELILDDGRHSHLGARRWLEGLDFDFLMALVQLIDLLCIRLVHVVLIRIFVRCFILCLLG